jgi:hypothetical protein
MADNNRNTGHGNTGHYNTGDRNTGFFCVETPAPTFFDKSCSLTWEEACEAVPCVELPIGCVWVDVSKMTDDEKQNHPTHRTAGGFLRILHTSIQTAFPVAWAKLDVATRRRFLNLPNFDADKFLACTGVDVRLDADLFPKAVHPVNEIKSETAWEEVTIDGKRYKLVPSPGRRPFLPSVQVTIDGKRYKIVPVG